MQESYRKQPRSRLLYFSPSSVGGLADYAHEQANALSQLGVAVEMLTTAQRPPRVNNQYETRPVLRGSAEGCRSRIFRKMVSASTILKNSRTLNRQIQLGDHKAVLLESYSEYLAPVWAWRLRARAREGVKFGAIVHDPVRDYVVGPKWWHRRSVAAGYSFISEAFVHDEIQLDTVQPMPDLRTTTIPHGAFNFPKPTASREQARRASAIPENAMVILSFGHIRDGKNLDLAIRALVDLPAIYLVVAGREQSAGQKPISYYQKLAAALGVQERCRWIHRFIPEMEIGNLFAGADAVLLTYSKKFRSASGVLNAAVTYRKPCIASCGGGNLRSVVERYELGWFVKPDNLTDLKAGMAAASGGHIWPRWDLYEAENSWQRNAQLVRERMFDGKR